MKKCINCDEKVDDNHDYCEECAFERLKKYIFTKFSFVNWIIFNAQASNAWSCHVCWRRGSLNNLP